MNNKSLALIEALSAKAESASAYTKRGHIYEKCGPLDQAEALYKMSLDINEALGDKAGLANAYRNLGSVQLIRGDFDDAIRMYKAIFVSLYLCVFFVLMMASSRSDNGP